MSIHLKDNEILVLKTVSSEGKAFFNGFQYPLAIGSIVTVPDWNSKLECDQGLYGLPWGEGYYGYLCTNSPALWTLIAVNTQSDYVRFSDKCKFRSGRIEFVGNKVDAVKILQKYAPANTHINFANQVGLDNIIQVAGDKSTQTAGDVSIQIAGYASIQKIGNESTQIAGNWSVQQGGYRSTQTAGDRSAQTAEYVSIQTAGDRSAQTAGYASIQKIGDYSTQIAGNLSVQQGGYRSTQTAGNRSEQTAGYKATQTAGDYSTQTADDYSTQTAGDYSTQTARNKATQTAGIGTVQICRYYIGSEYKTCTRIITEKEANKPYLFKNGIWTEVKG